MDSRTKLKLGRDELEQVVRGTFGTAHPLLSVQELTGGMFSAAYALELKGHEPVVLKLAPPPGAPLLTYEQELMRTEVSFYERAKEASIPVPRVLARDFTRSVVPSDCFFMERLSGAPLNRIRPGLSKKESAQVREELGACVARLSQVRGPFYGYPQPEARAQSNTWREAFLSMVSNILEDARRFGVRLPMDSHELLERVGARASVLDEVSEPVLVHFDLWDGNLFVHRVGDTAHLEAIIDGERAFYGDPCAELVSVALFRDSEREVDFLRGYAQQNGRPLVFTEPLRERLALYRLYLYLILVVESEPRGYSGFRHTVFHQYFRHKLRVELRGLVSRTGD